MKVRLVVQHQKANVKSVVLHTDAVIGRSTECNLRLASGQISRKHCKLLINDERVAVLDLGSANGTFLNGERLEPNVETPVPPEAELVVGPVTFSVEYLDPGADTAISRQSPADSGQFLAPADRRDDESSGEMPVFPDPNEDAAEAEPTGDTVQFHLDPEEETVSRRVGDPPPAPAEDAAEEEGEFKKRRGKSDDDQDFMQFLQNLDD